MRFVVWLFVLVFAAFAVVQWNDPDPLVWIGVYACFSLLGLTVLYLRLPWFVYLSFGITTVLWAAFQWPEKWEGFGESMLNENMERAREACGLLICAAASFLYAWIAVRFREKVKQIDNFIS